jgi:hypothetical protein
VLEQARHAVGVLRQTVDPDLTHTNFVDAAVRRFIYDVENRYRGIGAVIRRIRLRSGGGLGSSDDEPCHGVGLRHQ